MATDHSRIPTARRSELGLSNALIARIAALAAGSSSLNLFTTLGRHRRLFRAWLRFAAALEPGGLLPPADRQLVILRVAHNSDCDYEWRHHERLAERAGLPAERIARVRVGALAPGWSERQSALLQATDELHFSRRIGDAVWGRLRTHLPERELIELCMLVGHYEMLAMTISSLKIAPDEPAARGLPALAGALIARRFQRAGRRERNLS